MNCYVKEIINVNQIAEISTHLGDKCALLRKYGLYAYKDTEETLFDVLHKTINDPQSLNICLKSRCGSFLDGFKSRVTPFIERDPIKLTEYNGLYWVGEGKHRTCLAKRIGVKYIEAEVYHSDKDLYTLLPSEGMPGEYKTNFSYVNVRNEIREITGTLYFLWLANVNRIFPFNKRQIWFDTTKNTNGEVIEIIPGISYSLSVSRFSHCRFLFFQSREIVEGNITIRISQKHPKIKIWLMEIPASNVLFHLKSNNKPFDHFKTLYRYGCWRTFHLKQLKEYLPSFWLQSF